MIDFAASAAVFITCLLGFISVQTTYHGQVEDRFKEMSEQASHATYGADEKKAYGWPAMEDQLPRQSGARINTIQNTQTGVFSPPKELSFHTRDIRMARAYIRAATGHFRRQISGAQMDTKSSWNQGCLAHWHDTNSSANPTTPCLTIHESALALRLQALAAQSLACLVPKACPIAIRAAEVLHKAALMYARSSLFLLRSQTFLGNTL